jgi:presenilin-like A22 family membrane protease
MKHNLSVTLLIVALFLMCHIIGLFLVYISNPVVQTTTQTGEVITVHETTETPGIGKIEPMAQPYIPILIGVLVGTGIMLLLIKFRKFFIMRGWHIFGIAICLYISFYTLLNYFFSQYASSVILASISIFIAAVLALIRAFRPNIYVHNFSELFMYGGIAVLFANLFKTADLTGASLIGVSILLIGISIYDAIAVWQSKHMITLAQSQTEQKIFAGIFIPYKRKDSDVKLQADIPKTIYGNKSSLKVFDDDKSELVNKRNKSNKQKNSKTSAVTVHEETKSAILGGGDIAFTLLFSAVVLLSTYSFLKAFIVSVVAAIALAGLLFFAKKDKFYPAMPFLSAGCFIGYAIILLIP